MGCFRGAGIQFGLQFLLQHPQKWATIAYGLEMNLQLLCNIMPNQKNTSSKQTQCEKSPGQTMYLISYWQQQHLLQRAYTYIHTFIHSYIHTRTHARTHAHTHTHTRASCITVSDCLLWCGPEPSECTILQRHREATFDSLSSKHLAREFKLPLTSGRRVTYAVRRGALACCRLLRITASWVTDKFPGTTVSSPLPADGQSLTGLQLLPHRLPEPNHYLALKSLHQTFICMEIDICDPR